MQPAVDVDRLQRELESIFGPRRVSLRAVDLDTYARDMWPRLLIAYRDGIQPAHRPHAVVWPENVREVVAAVRLARELKIPIVPYGGGSGVCGGAVPLYAPFAAKYKYSPILPSAGFNFRVNDDIGVFGSYAKGVSSPRTDNLYRAPVVDVNPEKTDAFDLGLRYTSPTIQGQVTAWYIKYANRIVTSFDADQGISVDRNVGSVNSYGVDAGLTVRPVRWLSLTGNASYTRAKLQDNIVLSGMGTALSPFVFAVTKGKQVVETPEWQFGGRAQVELGPVEIGFQGKYVGKRYATDVNDVIVPSYTLFDVDARFSLEDYGLKRTWLQLNVQNLFDEFYYGNISNQINASTVGCVNAAGTAVGCGSSSQPSFSVGFPRTVTASIRIGF